MLQSPNAPRIRILALIGLAVFLSCTLAAGPAHASKKTSLKIRYIVHGAAAGVSFGVAGANFASAAVNYTACSAVGSLFGSSSNSVAECVSGHVGIIAGHAWLASGFTNLALHIVFKSIYDDRYGALQQRRDPIVQRRWLHWALEPRRTALVHPRFGIALAGPGF